MGMVTRWGRAMVVLAVVAAASCGAQMQATRMPAGAEPDWEVATVRATDPASPRGQHIDIQGRRVLMLGTTVQQFLLMGYGLQKSQLANLPGWAETERWDVSGVPDVDGSPNLPQLQSLMRKILVERFGLKFHKEQREQPVFALTIAKGGTKLVENTSDPNGIMDQQNSMTAGRRVENLKNTSLSDLVLILQFYTSRPVVDQTGLKGRYDLHLEWTVDDAPVTDAPDAPPGLSTALQTQAGLKLTPTRAPVDTLVIDTVERPKPE